MKTRFFLAIAAVAIMAVSCSVNETEVINVPTSDAIALNPSTAATRASVTYISNLQNGFAVYANTTNNAWYSDGTYTIDGSHKHVYQGGKWNFEVPSPGLGIKWPDAGNYPIDFYAFYPITNDAMTLVPTTPTPTSFTMDVKISPDVQKQIDIVSAKGSASMKPATANLALNFNHILSKVNFAITNSNDHADDKAFVQAVGFKSVNSANNFNVLSQLWNTTGHKDLEIYNYYNTFIEDGVSGTVELAAKLFDKDADKTRFYDGTTNPTLINANMMLLPQSPKMWIVPQGTQKADLPEDDEAFVRIMYRYEHNQDKDYIGFRDAQDHPDILNSVTHKNYDGPLYVKAGFTYSGTWTQGKGYLYEIKLPGAGGGRLLDKMLYDKYGNRTDLEFPGGEPGEPIITADEYIHLIPIVTEWGDDIEEEVKI